MKKIGLLLVLVFTMSAITVSQERAITQGPVKSSPATPGQIQGPKLSWSDTQSCDSFNIYRGTAPGGEGTVPYMSFPGTILSYQDSAVTCTSPPTTYYYVATCVAGGNESPVSNEGSKQVVCPTPPKLNPVQ